MKGIRTKSIILSLLLVVLSVQIAWLLQRTTTNSLPKKEQLLQEVGTRYYDRYLYPQMFANMSSSEIVAKLKSYQDVGIQLNLEAIKLALMLDENDERYAEILRCSALETEIRVYPTAPFTQYDYYITASQSCD